MIKIYCIGICILVTAIFANFIANKLGILSWYDFLNYFNEKGISFLKSISLIDYLWLFLVYPFLLGIGYLIGFKLYELIFG